MKTIESRVAKLEKEVARIRELVLDNRRLLKHTEPVMTVQEAGTKGGKATGKKGLAAMTPERRAEIRAKALVTRRNRAAERRLNEMK